MSANPRGGMRRAELVIDALRGDKTLNVLGINPAFEALEKAFAAAPEKDLVSFPEYAALEAAVKDFDAAYTAWARAFR